jgi:hypothetical protein
MRISLKQLIKTAGFMAKQIGKGMKKPQDENPRAVIR